MLLQTLRVSTLFVLLIFSVAMLWPFRREEPGRTWLGVLLLVNAILISGGLAIANNIFSAASAPVAFSIFYAAFTLPPLCLYLAVRGLVEPVAVSQSDLITFVPSGLFALALVLVCLVWPVNANPYTSQIVWILLLLVLHLIAISSFLITVQLTQKAAVWIKAIFYIFLVHWMFSAASGITSMTNVPGSLIFEGASITGLLIFALFVAGFSVRHLARQIPGVPEPDTIAPDTLKLSYKLKHLFELDRVYLDANLTLETLATKAGATEREVSRALNTTLGGGFHEVVRKYRVQEAQRLLHTAPDAPIIQILYDAGFNSKSAFHRAFSEQAGMTPSEYRKRHVASKTT